LSYIPLHVHSINSPYEGMITPEELVSRSSFLGLPAVALTDHWTTYGHFEFYRHAKEAGIKPLLGVELNHASLVGARDRYHLTAIAANNDGYMNLVRLVNAHFTKGKEQYVTPEELSEFCGGLIILTGCLKGEASQAILHGNLGREREVVERLIGIYGADNIYIEIMNHNLPEERLVFDHLTMLSNRLGIPLVATNNDRYLKKEESEYFELLIGMRNRGNDGKRESLPAEFYLKREKEIEPFFYAAGDAVHRSGEIADRCDVDPFEQGSIAFSTAQSPDDTLQEMCKRRFLLKFHNRSRDETVRLRQTLDKELLCAEREKLAGFLLFLHELFQQAVNRGIWLEVMGGNLLESLIAYLLNIVPLNPVEYDLVLETFATSKRGVPSSLELITSEQRKESLVTLVGELLPGYLSYYLVLQEEMSFQTIAKELVELLGAPENIKEELTRILGSDRKNRSLAKILEGSEAMTHLYNNNEVARKALHGAQALRGRICHFNQNSSRLAVLPPETGRSVSFNVGAEGERYVLCSTSAIDSLGGWLIGIQHSHFLAALDMSVKEMRSDASGGMIDSGDEESIDRWTPEVLDDPQAYALISSGDTTGVYLLESRGIRDLLVKIEPRDFGELINAISLYRPAPLEGRLWERYVENAEKKGKVFLPHHLLAASLEGTRGLLLYEEQVREVLNYTAGLECDRALEVERALKSRDSGDLLSSRLEFIRGAMDRRVDEEDAQKIFDFLLHNISYTHSKALSCSQAYLSYRTAFLKSHYFEQYFVALLNSNMDVRDRRKRYIEYLEDRDVEILSPDINMSDILYSLEEDAVRPPLLTGRSSEPRELQEIISERERGGAFKTFEDYLRRMYEMVSLKTSLDLIEEGVFDIFSTSRKDLAARCRDFYGGGGRSGLFSPAAYRPAGSKKKKQPESQLSLFEGDDTDSVKA
jgi:DNA polymerase-3 subunit alpha